MYATCLFCSSALGANDAFECFPVGRRLAFDARKGRLWVVCRRCERWNLTPLDERWEAIEECERRFRGARLHASTDNIGLARLPEGLELIRIGAALRPEIAIWRYGTHLRWRYFSAAGRRTLDAMAVGCVVGATLAGVLAPAASLAMIGLTAPLVHLYRRGTMVDELRSGDGRRCALRRCDVDDARIIPEEESGGWALELPHQRGMTLLRGGEATAALGRLLVHVNRRGASHYSVGVALERLSLVERTDDLIAATARSAERAVALEYEAERRRSWWNQREGDDYEPPTLGDLDFHLRLALEMALHEEMERRALEGELALLGLAWREAEEIAAIADEL